MSFEKTDDLERALAALTVQAVWRAAMLPNPPREGNVLVGSPFREDKKKSFSICFRGHGFKDHADASSKGGVWEFAKRATGKDGKELADWVIELSGVPRTPFSRREATGDGREVEPVKLSRRARPKVYASAAQKRALEVQRAEALKSRVVVRDVPAWAGGVRDRWMIGAGSAVSAAAELSASRGWPIEWLGEMANLGLVSLPLLPWLDTVRGRADERGVAFLVESPLYQAGVLRGTRPVGYHQRFVIRGEKSWVYVPYLPPAEKCRSEFQKQLRAEALARGADEAGAALVPGLPFVLQGGAACSHLVITEGQWDAITFAGACGWLDSDTAWPEGWWVMGARGANGADTLLAYWRPWLERHKPRVLVLADNDKASLGWDHARMSGQAEPWRGEWEPGVVPSFVEKLQALGCADVRVRRVQAAVGKDFNDYWKAKRPTPAAMADWLAKIGMIK